MKQSLIATLTLASLILTSPSMATGNKHQKAHHKDRQVFTDYAYVTRVNPVYERASHCDTYDNHHDEHGYSHRAHHNSHSKKHSNNRHNRVNKVIGKIHNKDLSLSIDYNNRHHPHKRNCKIGYDVTYRYHGQSYATFTKQRPGHRIELKIRLTPIENF